MFTDELVVTCPTTLEKSLKRLEGDIKSVRNKCFIVGFEAFERELKTGYPASVMEKYQDKHQDYPRYDDVLLVIPRFYFIKLIRLAWDNGIEYSTIASWCLTKGIVKTLEKVKHDQEQIVS